MLLLHTQGLLGCVFSFWACNGKASFVSCAFFLFHIVSAQFSVSYMWPVGIVINGLILSEKASQNSWVDYVLLMAKQKRYHQPCTCVARTQPVVWIVDQWPSDPVGSFSLANHLALSAGVWPYLCPYQQIKPNPVTDRCLVSQII